jgi:hypothetical protein
LVVSDLLADWLWLSAGELQVGFDAATGSIRQIRLKSSGVEFIDGAAPASPAWRIELTDGRLLITDVAPSIASQNGTLTFRWISDEVTFIAEIQERPEGLCFRGRLNCKESSRPRVLEYPVLGGLQRRDIDGSDWLLHPYATGLLVHDPVLTFDPQGLTSPLAPGFIHSPYPEGFSGATLQFMALGGPGGGLYVAVEDPTSQPKWLDAYRTKDGLLEMRIGHANPDYEEPAIPETPPVLLSALHGDHWWEAAQRYKAWAIHQPWCQRGPVESDARRPKWLFEDTGLVTFGIDAASDRSPWLHATHDAAGASVLHILGPDWANHGQDYVDHLPSSLDDWLPARVHSSNLSAISEQGDHFALFEFDLLTGRNGPGADLADGARQRFSQPIRSSDAYGFPFLCPTTEYARTLHRDRDQGLVRAPAVDALYYDISANNVLSECVATTHPHRPGGGPEVAAGYAMLYRESRAATEGAAGHPVAIGAEMINERLIGELDYYQARAGGAPAASFETDRFYERVLSGSVELVPLFAAIYHELGPVRTDGWAKLSAEQGDLVFWNLARVVAWGGLPQVNAEYSPLESLPGHPAPLTDHYAPLRADHAFAVDASVLAFLGELAYLRTRLATRFLAYGTMLGSPAVDCDMVDLSWFHYNGPLDSPAFDQRGLKRVPAIVAAAWLHGGDLAVVLVNADVNSREARVHWSPADIDSRGIASVELRSRHHVSNLGRVSGGETTRVVVAPRSALVIEIDRQTTAN